jgi:hypothetical protein
MSQHSVIYGSVFLALTGATALGAWTWLRGRKSPEEKERLRRDFLVQHGRLIDGTVLDYTDHEVPVHDHKIFRKSEPLPLRKIRILHFQYEIAGVLYEGGQDVSFLPEVSEQLTLDGSCLGMPASIRYHVPNPANSIVVAENWNGLYSHRAQQRRPVQASEADTTGSASSASASSISPVSPSLS